MMLIYTHTHTPPPPCIQTHRVKMRYAKAIPIYVQVKSFENISET